MKKVLEFIFSDTMLLVFTSLAGVYAIDTGKYRSAYVLLILIMFQLHKKFKS